MEAVPAAETPSEQVTRAMAERRRQGWEPRAVARALGLPWSPGDEERWYDEHVRCPACRCWMPAQSRSLSRGESQGDGFCQCCLAC